MCNSNGSSVLRFACCLRPPRGSADTRSNHRTTPEVSWPAGFSALVQTCCNKVIFQQQKKRRWLVMSQRRRTAVAHSILTAVPEQLQRLFSSFISRFATEDERKLSGMQVPLTRCHVTPNIILLAFSNFQGLFHDTWISSFMFCCSFLAAGVSVLTGAPQTCGAAAPPYGRAEDWHRFISEGLSPSSGD